MNRTTDPPHRPGPRPLALHLALTQTVWLTSLAVWPMLSAGWRPWIEPWMEAARRAAPEPARVLETALEEALQALRDGLGPGLAGVQGAHATGTPDGAFTQALEREIRRRTERFLAGLELYRASPCARDVVDPPALWEEGGTRLLDYGAVPEAAPNADTPAGRPLLVVPSLVNRGYVLDLSSRRSFLRWLAARGWRPLLVDWGWPDEAARGFSLTDYVAGRLARALAAAQTATAVGPAPMPVLGYCMGGLLATALARQRPDAVSALVLMATPWDFHAGASAAQARLLAGALEPMRPWIALWGELPVDVLQALFTTLDPLLALSKFSRFAELDPESDKARDFVALEDWLNDGVPLAAPVAEECLFGWYGENTPAEGRWQVAGLPVDPSAIGCPSLHVIPAADRIVPPPSAKALARAMPGAETRSPALGHIGMAVSARAERAVWQPLAEWLDRTRK